MKKLAASICMTSCERNTVKSVLTPTKGKPICRSLYLATRLYQDRGKLSMPIRMALAKDRTQPGFDRATECSHVRLITLPMMVNLLTSPPKYKVSSSCQLPKIFTPLHSRIKIAAKTFRQRRYSLGTAIKTFTIKHKSLNNRTSMV